ATNGTREIVQSIVGWPKDPVARKMLGKDIVFGDDVIRHRLALETVRPFEKGALKYIGNVEAGIQEGKLARYKEAAKELVRHVIQTCRPPRGTLVYGVIGSPARASILNKQALMDACKGTFEAVMIVSEPFAVAYGMNVLEDALVVDIGAGTTDLCRMHGAIPTEEDQITTSKAGDHIDEEAAARIRRKHPGAQFSINMVRDAKERFSFVNDVNDKAIVTWPDAHGKPTAFDITAELKDACKTIVPEIVEGLHQLVSSFDAEFQRRMLQNVVLAGGGSQLRGLDRLIEEDLQKYGGGRVTKVHEPDFAGANGALKLATDMPEDYWKQLD
ncbi:MAG TPA: rod shape-determining protein, partial [Planctomycetota bacterium]|nr:rod shape-determining protein [Planctomycetota bacterium]